MCPHACPHAPLFMFMFSSQYSDSDVPEFSARLRDSDVPNVLAPSCQGHRCRCRHTLNFLALFPYGDPVFWQLRRPHKAECPPRLEGRSAACPEPQVSVFAVMLWVYPADTQDNQTTAIAAAP